MTFEPESPGDPFGRAVENFETDRANAIVLRRLAKEDPASFVERGLEILRAGADTPVSGCLADLLLKMPSFFLALCDPRNLKYEDALALAARLMARDPIFDTRLAQCLPGRGDKSAEMLRGAAAERALDILDEVSIGQRLIPILSHLTTHSDARLSSKVALILGKRVQNLGWAKRIIEEAVDPRLRANAIESVWGSRFPEVVDIFREYLTDNHHRVVGNCIVGLQIAGETDAIRIVEKVAADPQPDFRMAAAWAMGKMGDAAFVERLSPLLKDSSLGVRRAAFRSIRLIREIEKRDDEAKTKEEQSPDPIVELRAELAEAESIALEP